MAFLVLMLAFLLFTQTAPASQKQTLSVAVYEWTPFSGKDLINNGYVVDLVVTALEDAGYNVDKQIMPFNRAMVLGKRGDLDIIPDIWYTDERNEYFHYSAPLLENQFILVSKKSDRIVDTLDDLIGLTVGTVTSSYYPPAFLNDNRHVKENVVEPFLNIQKLHSGRIHATIDDAIVLKHAARRLGLKDDFHFSKNSIGREALYMGLSRKTPNGKEIIHKFNASLQKLRDNGIIEQMQLEHSVSP